MAFLYALPGAVAEGLIWGLMAIGVYISYKILDIADLTVDGSICTGACVCAVLLALGVDPIWLGVMVGVNLQTSFLTPPFGFALFYLRGVAPPRVSTGMIYRGIIPFVLIQILALFILFFFPQIITWLPSMLY